MDVLSPLPNNLVMELNYGFKKRATNLKTPFLEVVAIRLSLITGRIVTPHTRLHLEPLTAVYASMS